MAKSPHRAPSKRRRGRRLLFGLVAAGLGLLVVATEKDVNIGLIRLEMKNACSRIRSGS